MESGFHPERSTGGKVEKEEPWIVGIEIREWLEKKAKLGNGCMTKRLNITLCLGNLEVSLATEDAGGTACGMRVRMVSCGWDPA